MRVGGSARGSARGGEGRRDGRGQVGGHRGRRPLIAGHRDLDVRRAADGGQPPPPGQLLGPPVDPVDRHPGRGRRLRRRIGHAAAHADRGVTVGRGERRGGGDLAALAGGGEGGGQGGAEPRARGGHLRGRSGRHGHLDRPAARWQQADAEGQDHRQPTRRNPSEVDHGAREGPGDPGDLLDAGNDQAPEVVDRAGLRLDDDVVRAGHVVGDGDAVDGADLSDHRRGRAPRSGSGCRRAPTMLAFRRGHPGAGRRCVQTSVRTRRSGGSGESGGPMSGGGELISDVGEFGLIGRIDVALDGHSATGVHVGIGDDAVVVGVSGGRVVDLHRHARRGSALPPRLVHR